MLTADLKTLCTRVDDKIAVALESAAEEFSINVQTRWQPFLAQLAHESGCFRYRRELASGEAYEGRTDLGNTRPGDGRLFKGWGWMQTTGRKNTGIVSQALYGDDRLVALAGGVDSLINPPSLELCARAAGHFWTIGAGLNLSKRALKHGLQPGCNLNDVADAGDFIGITLAVNGGMNGYDDRLAFFEKLNHGSGHA